VPGLGVYLGDMAGGGCGYWRRAGGAAGDLVAVGLRRKRGLGRSRPLGRMRFVRSFSSHVATGVDFAQVLKVVGRVAGRIACGGPYYRAAGGVRGAPLAVLGARRCRVSRKLGGVGALSVGYRDCRRALSEAGRALAGARPA
jgi:hypothetical protein